MTIHAIVRNALLAALVLTITACDGEKHAAPPSTATGGNLFVVPENQRAKLQLVKVEKKPVVRPVVVPAKVEFNDLKTSEVTPLVSGKVARILVHEGDRVKMGASLMTIASPDSSDNAANLARDVSALRTKEAILARDQDLYAHKAISLEELQQAQLDVTSAKATVANDKTHMHITGSSTGDALLRAPIAGVVVQRQVAVGDVIQAESTPCFTITDPSAVWVVSQLYQEDLRRVAVGDEARIRSPVLDAPIEGKVTYIGASIDTDTLTIPVRIAAENPNGLLRKGMYVNAEILPAKTENAVVIPAAAVLRDSDNLPFVYVQVAPGKLARRHVDLGDQLGDGYAIEKGLKDGEEVLANGAIFVQFADTLER